MHDDRPTIGRRSATCVKQQASSTSVNEVECCLDYGHVVHGVKGWRECRSGYLHLPAFAPLV